MILKRSLVKTEGRGLTDCCAPPLHRLGGGLRTVAFEATVDLEATLADTGATSAGTNCATNVLSNALTTTVRIDNTGHYERAHYLHPLVMKLYVVAPDFLEHAQEVGAEELGDFRV